MKPGPPQDEAREGLRLAKCVMALAACSRREAEALIEAGAVLVEGQPVTEPARRVQPAETVTLAPDARATLRTLDTPLTLLWHDDRPPGVTAPATVSGLTPGPAEANPLALLQGAPAVTPSRLTRLHPLLPLQTGQRGLALWSDDPSVQRRLLDRQRPLEQEWRVASRQPWSAPSQAALAASGWRASLGQQQSGRWTYRLVGRTAGGPPLPEALCAALDGPLWRLRIGAVALAPLAPGQARWLRPGERF